MKRLGIVSLVALFFISCTKNVSATDIDKMNGYWEIEKVVFANGKTKLYKNSEMYDFFQIKDFTGMRKKVTPVIGGSYLVNLDAEKVTIKQGKDKFIVHYETFYSRWDEELISISDEEMVLKNDKFTEYHYKRAKPLKIVNYGKKTQ
jgi:hypothetical protein